MISCTSEAQEEYVPHGEAQIRIAAVAEQTVGDGGTKISLDDDATLIWQSGDKISIVGSSRSTFTISGGEGTGHAEFSGNLEAAGKAPYYAVMPYSSSARRSEDGLSMKISQRKYARTNDIAFGAVPMAGVVQDGEVYFRNLFGLLKVTFTSKTPFKVKKIALHDLGGNMLWGDCFIPVKADTLAYSDIVLTGGDNTINMNWNAFSTISETPASLYFPVPPGSLDRGFSMVLYEYDTSAPDSIGRAYTFVQKVTDNVSAIRSTVILMDETALTDKSEPLDIQARGYYKTLFVEAGPKLSNNYTKSHFKWLTTLGIGDDYEYFAGDSTAAVISRQASILNRNAEDANGVLLYPDGEPRFRMMYVNGGTAASHARTMYQDGRSRVHDFFLNGGSYVGTCAGGYIARSIYNEHNCYDNPDTTLNTSYGIWPGMLTATSIPVNTKDFPTSYVAQKFSKQFGPFAEGDTVEQVRHHGGFYVSSSTVNNAIPHETLMVYQYSVKNPSDSTSYNDYNRTHYAMYGYGSASGPKASRVNRVSMIAYKPSVSTGRAVLFGSHPEKEQGGKKLLLMETMVNYALSGNGDPSIKAELEPGVVREMTRTTMDKDPAFTRIGDRQYHHFTFTNTTARPVRVTLSSDAGTDLYLALHKGDYAWLSDAEYVICSKGANKTLDIKSLPAGKWYLSVYCPQTVTATPRTGSNHLAYFQYSGKTEVLDGVPYSILIE